MEFKETIWENNSEWNTIEFKGKFINIEVSSLDKDGDVAIEITVDNEPVTIFLNQENIQQLITHLQKQLK